MGVFILDRFGISFHEGGPVGECVVLLYAVNEDLYKKIEQWFTCDTNYYVGIGSNTAGPPIKGCL